MVLDAIRGYWALASGLTEVTRHKATAAARALVSQGEATAEQVGAIAEDLISTSLSNRAALVNLVRVEVDRARSVVGLATSSDLAALTGRISALESQLAAALAGAAAAPGRPAPLVPKLTEEPPPATARKTAAKRTAATAAKAAPPVPQLPADAASNESEGPGATTARTTAAKKTAARAAEATKPDTSKPDATKPDTTKPDTRKAAAEKAAVSKASTRPPPAASTRPVRTGQARPDSRSAEGASS